MTTTCQRIRALVTASALVLVAAACSSGEDSQARQPPEAVSVPVATTAPVEATTGEPLAVTVLSPELCTAVQAWAQVAPSLSDQVLENMRPGVDTSDLQEAADAVAALDVSGDVGAFVSTWTSVMRQRQGFITAIGGPTDLFETDRMLYETELLKPVGRIDSAAISARIGSECGVVVPVAG